MAKAVLAQRLRLATQVARIMGEPSGDDKFLDGLGIISKVFEFLPVGNCSVDLRDDSRSCGLQKCREAGLQRA
jgi:hypothetical protein